jgi:hypothetical protein
MRYQPDDSDIRIPIDAGRQIAQLRHVLRLVEELGGLAALPGASDTSGADLDEAARIGALYHQAHTIVQRRFDTLAAETAAWSAAGVEALLAAGETRSPAAVRRLAEELEAALRNLVAMLPAAGPPSTAAAAPSL